jgi:hypothetical protein
VDRRQDQAIHAHICGAGGDIYPSKNLELQTSSQREFLGKKKKKKRPKKLHAALVNDYSLHFFSYRQVIH